MLRRVLEVVTHLLLNVFVPKCYFCFSQWQSFYISAIILIVNHRFPSFERSYFQSSKYTLVSSLSTCNQASFSFNMAHPPRASIELFNFKTISNISLLVLTLIPSARVSLLFNTSFAVVYIHS